MSRSTSAPRVLVLGGSGFVGRHVCAAFLARGWEVHGWARRDRGAPGVVTRAVDLVRAEPGRLAAELAAVAPDTVVNAAGAVWGVNEAEMAAANEAAVSRVLTALGAAAPCFVQLGSVHEHTAATAYGRIKAAAAARVLAAGGTVLRLPNLLGPGTPEGSFLGRVGAQLARAARTGEAVTVTTLAVRERREFLDVRDAADAVVAAADPSTARNVRGRALDLGTGHPVDVRELLDALIRISGVPARVEERLPDPGWAPPGGLAGVGARPADPDEVARLLGWRAVRGPQESLRGLWEAAATASTGPLVTG
ncbi:NAD-dependent epimerase/dehydratase family protein [Streptomyces sp. ISL-36]|uniref:NAD-dependent epimerase/dehydratase family protein n=1 Tax=Streptomyces sp. ISL-36 TaxID=2819182 RepID=UPI001BE80C58|nr:NAD-dependent epimerase/dehydratase family protein [Streptomyces sp. ISL-36]MBT2438960.1 NAD-dependent epimerase/dehydratase family protein [Streptomyces sp. ISL-36]